MSEGVALITGAGPGLGAALGRRFAAGGFTVALAARQATAVDAAARTIPGAQAFTCDVSDEAQVGGLFARLERDMGPVEVAVQNASAGHGKVSILDLEVARLQTAWRVTALGGFLVGREAARRMAGRGRGSILFTGATASLRGSAGFAAFAQGKFALRAIAQSMARELGPKGIHVAHMVIDGGIGDDAGDARLKPDAIAEAYWQVHAQHRSAWTFEVDLRPWGEKF